MAVCTDVKPEICLRIGAGLRGRLWDHGVACVTHLLLMGDPRFVVCTVVSPTGTVPLDEERAHRELRITAQTWRTAGLDTYVVKEI